MSRLRLVFFAGLVGLATLVELGLGVWQWNRRSEKLAYIGQVERAANSDPVAIAAAKPWDRVQVTGRYLPEKSVHIIFSRPEAGPDARRASEKAPPGGLGVLLMTPFVFEDCLSGACSENLVFVNRGFVPTPPNGAVPPLAIVPAPVSVTGFVRPSETKALVQPGNDVAKRIFFLRNLPDLAAATGLPAIETRYFIDRQADPGDRGAPYGISVADFLAAIPNNHLEYALTWWALGATNVIIALLFLFQRRKKHDPAR